MSDDDEGLIKDRVILYVYVTVGVSALSQVPRWDLNSRPPYQKSDLQPLEPEKHAQPAEASCNTQPCEMPLLHIWL